MKERNPVAQEVDRSERKNSRLGSPAVCESTGQFLPIGKKMKGDLNCLSDFHWLALWG